jgi:hypothetical protein
MQKKKPSFQAIPICRVSGLTNWNESKEVPMEQGCNGAGLCGFSDRRRHFLQLIASLRAICSIGGSDMPTAMMAASAVALAVVFAWVDSALWPPVQRSEMPGRADGASQ